MKFVQTERILIAVLLCSLFLLSSGAISAGSVIDVVVSDQLYEQRYNN